MGRNMTYIEMLLKVMQLDELRERRKELTRERAQVKNEAYNLFLEMKEILKERDETWFIFTNSFEYNNFERRIEDVKRRENNINTRIEILDNELEKVENEVNAYSILEEQRKSIDNKYRYKKDINRQEP